MIEVNMTRSYIQKKVRSTEVNVQCEDTQLSSCHCESRKMKINRKKSSTKVYSHKFLLIFIIGFVSCVNSLSYAETSSVSSIQMKKFVEDSQDVSTTSEDDDSEEFDDYETPHLREEVARKYQEMSKKYDNPKKSQNSHEAVHHEIHELPSPTTNSPSKCSGSCLDRQAKENEALDAFKKTLLMKLGIEKPPNVTKAHSVPDQILEGLCKKMNMPIEYCTNKQPNYKNLEYQSDDPNSYGHDQIIEQTEDVQYNAVENRIYAFPKCEFFVVIFTFFLEYS